MKDAYFGVALERMRVQESMKSVNKRKWRKSTKKYKRNMKQNQVCFLCFIFNMLFFLNLRYVVSWNNFDFITFQARNQDVQN